MKNFGKFAAVLFALVLLFPVFAQETEEPATEEAGTFVTDPAEYQPYGDVEIGEYEVLGEDVDGGAIVITAETPADQHPNVDVVGPDGYWEHFEVEDGAEELVLDDLEPGVYSVAATDDGLQLVTTLVEVREDASVSVQLNMTPIETFDYEAYEPADYVPYPYGYYGVGAYEVGAYEPYDSEEFGSFTVDTATEDAIFVVTGPNGYSEDFEGDFTAEELLPGIYQIAGTADDSSLVAGKVAVQAARAVKVVPTIVAVETVTETEVISDDSQEGDMQDDGAEDTQDDGTETEEDAQ